MNTEKTVFMAGTSVVIHPQGIGGIVLCAAIKRPEVPICYEVEWFTADRRQTSWFDEWRVSAPIGSPTVLIGFGQDGRKA